MLKGVSCAKKLTKIYLADNQFGEQPEVLDALKRTMIMNVNLKRYDIKFNGIYDPGLEYLTDTLATATHVYEVEVSERVSPDVLNAFKARCLENKNAGKKKKGKKGKKGGKKKKKK